MVHDSMPPPCDYETDESTPCAKFVFGENKVHVSAFLSFS